MCRFLGLEWTLRILHLLSCSSLTSKGLFLMLERDCNDSARSIRLNYRRSHISLSCLLRNSWWNSRFAVNFGWHGRRRNVS
uniref:Secreted protein n=1 Tax=Salix viminalis TaxID=40686 RepID=A0A6N2M7G2_SALVM